MFAEAVCTPAGEDLRCRKRKKREDEGRKGGGGKKVGFSRKGGSEEKVNEWNINLGRNGKEKEE